MEKNQIMVVYGDQPERMTEMLLESADLAGMIPPNAFIGIKPNLVVAKPAETGATTHPQIVESVIRYLQRHGFSNLLILEGSWVGESTKRAFRTCGYEEVSRKTGVPLLDTKGEPGVTRRYGGLAMEICKKALELDFLINIPVLKGHCQTAVTGALKNLKGLITDSEKRRFHTLGLHKPIAYLNKVLTTSFVLVDGLCGDLDFEEGGNPVRMNRMFCGLDPVLTDSYIASCMGYSPYDIEYIRLAEEIGVGSADLSGAEILELNRDTSTACPPSSRKVQRLAGYISAKDACSACYANLIQAMARLDEEGRAGEFRSDPVKIGQGYPGKPGHLGVGNCTSCMEHSLPGCPPQAREILEFLKKL